MGIPPSGAGRRTHLEDQPPFTAPNIRPNRDGDRSLARCRSMLDAEWRRHTGGAREELRESSRSCVVGPLVTAAVGFPRPGERADVPEFLIGVDATAAQQSRASSGDVDLGGQRVPPAHASRIAIW